jgi:hypothetical protein
MDNPSGSTDDLPPSFATLGPTFTRREIAKNELERAILLWFEARIVDLPSVHTLAIAAQGVLDALCRDMKIPRSKLVTGTNAKGAGFARAIRNPQNFFKHGEHDRNYRGKKDKDAIEFPYELIEAVLSDNVETYHRLFGAVSALMVCFALRFDFEHPIIRSAKNTKAKLVRRFGIEEISRKPDFIRKVLPIVGEFALRKPHLESP